MKRVVRAGSVVGNAVKRTGEAETRRPPVRMAG